MRRSELHKKGSSYCDSHGWHRHISPAGVLKRNRGSAAATPLQASLFIVLVEAPLLIELGADWWKEVGRQTSSCCCTFRLYRGSDKRDTRPVLGTGLVGNCTALEDQESSDLELRLQAKKMADAVARVARKVNETVENEEDFLDLANCQLKAFPVGIYRVMTNVTEKIHIISLANNDMKSLTSKFITTFCQLQELNLEGNLFSKLPEEIGTLLHLKTINLSKNKFTEFPEQLASVKSLETINLEENQITDVPVDKLNSMQSLICVNLKSNPLNAESQNLSKPVVKFELLTSAQEVNTGIEA
ncbi:leucine-rich repeat-containing protein 20 [Lissotriton helveticus]